MSAAETIRKITGARVIEREPMSRHTTLGVGGPADIFVEVSTIGQLSLLMRYLGSEQMPWMVLGDGANLLVSDRGVRGVVIHLIGDLESIWAEGNLVRAGAAARVARVADFAAARGLGGLEGPGVVPGTIGGGIVMNAGTNEGGYIDQVVESVFVVDSDGEHYELSAEECGLRYRKSVFQDDRSRVIASASLRLKTGSAEEIRRSLEACRKRRLQVHPQGRSAGCFFKNPSGSHAGYLIEISGGKGMREGGAVVSDLHGNFIMNDGGATASDLVRLAERVRELIREKHGIELEYEVRLVGEW